MGLPVIIILVVIGIIAIPTLKAIAQGSGKTDEEKKLENRKRSQREKEGALDTVLRIFIGDERFENNKVRVIDAQRKETNRQQAKTAGFSSVKEFELKTDRNRDPDKFRVKNADGSPLTLSQQKFQDELDAVSVKSRFGGQKRRFQ